MNRKKIIITSGMAVAGGALAGSMRRPKRFDVSLAQWSVRELHLGVRANSPEFREKMKVMTKDASVFAGPVDPLDFAGLATKEFGIYGLEYVNTFYYTHAGDDAYFEQLRKRAEDAGAGSLLIMCDACGQVGAPKQEQRRKMLELHKPWIHAAAQLGCHSIRVNARSAGSFEDQQKLAADGLRMLAEYAQPYSINIIVENHGDLSSNGKWLAGVIKQVNLPNVGTLPDFGNFRISRDPEEWYDRYQGVTELMPFAKGVSAKSHAFDAEGNETQTDFYKMMRIVADSGYTGYIGVEYEGTDPDAKEGILMTKALLERAFERV
jgi:sugar phosphate isomerase/epimerase